MGALRMGNDFMHSLYEIHLSRFWLATILVNARRAQSGCVTLERRVCHETLAAADHEVTGRDSAASAGLRRACRTRSRWSEYA